MKAYLENILPKIALFSEKLDKLAYLVDEPWVLDSPTAFTKFIFKQDNTLLISENGNVSIGKWELLNKANSILIQSNNTLKLYNHGFLDNAVLILKIDGGSDYFVLLNQNKVPNLDLEKYIDNNYIKPIPIGVNFNSTKKTLIKGEKKVSTDKGEITIIFFTANDLPSVGDSVLVDNRPAPDSKFRISSMFYIYTKNGLIDKTSIF